MKWAARSQIVGFKILLLLALIIYGASCSSPNPAAFDLHKFAREYVNQVQTLSRQSNPDQGRRWDERGSRWFWFAIPSAAAQSPTGPATKPELDEQKKPPAFVDQAPIRKMQKRQAQRFDQIQQLKDRKMIGEASDGTLKVVKDARIPASEKDTINKLVAAENQDREELYKMIIKANNYDQAMEKVLRESFFKSYREWDPKQSYFFVDGYWQQ